MSYVLVIPLLHPLIGFNAIREQQSGIEISGAALVLLSLLRS